MADKARFNNPWLVAVWPGMGQVAIAAGYYLMMKLGAYSLAEFASQGLFDVDHVGVKNGLIQNLQLPAQPAVRLERSGRKTRPHYLHWGSPAADRQARLLQFTDREHARNGNRARDYFCRHGNVNASGTGFAGFRRRH